MSTDSLPRSGSPALRTDVPAAYLPLGGGWYEPTVHVQGAWRDDEQHMAPVTGLIAHEIARHEPREGMQLARVSCDILGVMAARPSQVEVRTVRPGRTIELLEATVSVEERVVVRAHAWRLSRQDSSAAAGVELEPMPGPDAFAAWDGIRVWDGGYIASLEVRADPHRRPGRARVWLRSPYELVHGETCSPSAELLRYVDTANGIAVRVSPREWMFPNTDLTVHLLREPVAGWVGLDTRCSIDAGGVGLTSTTVHDIAGPVGRAEQILTVRRIPAA